MMGRRWCHAVGREVIASVTALRALPPTRALKFKWGGQVDAFVFLDDGRPIAYVNQCSHVALEMDWSDAEFFAHGVLQCKVHGALFDPTTGACLRPPPRCKMLRSLFPIPIEVDADGNVVATSSPTSLRPRAEAIPLDDAYRRQKLARLQLALDREASEAQIEIDRVNERARRMVQQAREAKLHKSK
ncbi:hypothetical protein SPRG_19553 [Saprolegnia parasitica CBS 223.65]|uniref:Rieske domain-containing protein n=1 Tax=Saprolegnia parasitica (strain CBS 223.65) TaxID=695850 RepID=A0A067CLU5_SAPPC|nr:hypothetical protein SPRG_19553 [Saprolegnia parasitica CBS 223.65]KDO31498.1 hypothetical protein SPRG_19553 [Saprolegnia parasitica CBS 223.65]|eukprot:XP_012198112.1 hypothetical protein SPRG_19553 [Saprolegnia parasitica CBS 223.65]